MLRKIAYSLATLAMLAMAGGAGFKPTFSSFLDLLF